MTIQRILRLDLRGGISKAVTCVFVKDGSTGDTMSKEQPPTKGSITVPPVEEEENTAKLQGVEVQNAEAIKLFDLASMKTRVKLLYVRFSRPSMVSSMIHNTSFMYVEKKSSARARV